MKRLLVVVAVVAAIAIGIVIAALLFVDAEALRGPLQEQASRALDRDVTLGEMQLELFPPAVRVSELRVAGHDAKAEPFAVVPELGLRVALWPLLRGAVVVRALEVREPRLRIPLDAEGNPILPGPKQPAAGQPPSTPAPATGEEADGAEAAGGAPALAVERFALAGGSVRYGDWVVEGLDVDGRLDADGSANAVVSARVADWGELQGADVKLRGLGGDAVALEATGGLAAQLGPLAKAFELDAELSGELDGDFRIDVANGELTAGTLALASRRVQARSEDRVVDGPVELRAELGQALRLDLSGARVDVPGVLRKPAGGTLLVTAPLAARPGADAIGDIDVQVGDDKIALRLDPQTGRIATRPSKLDLGKLGPWLDAGLSEPTGVIEFVDLGFDPASGRTSGRARLANVGATVDGTPVVVSGALVGAGEVIQLSGAKVGIAEQTLDVDASYRLETGQIKTDVSGDNLAIARLLGLFTEQPPLEGVLNTRLSLSMRDSIATAVGDGRIDIRPGRILGFSLGKQLLGELSAVPLLVAQMKGKDLSRYDEESFDRLTGDFRLRSGWLESDNLELAYRHMTAYLKGRVGLAAGLLDLSGRVVLSRETDRELGRNDGRQTVIPITKIGGRLDSPRLVLDREAVAQAAVAIAGSGRTREKLEEKIGKEGADVVEDLLQQILKGGQK